MIRQKPVQIQCHATGGTVRLPNTVLPADDFLAGLGLFVAYPFSGRRKVGETIVFLAKIIPALEAEGISLFLYARAFYIHQ
ncbi:MAG: hypothetical protein EOO77_01760 [Oxalobacteraceae bacterium]|jgi:hypothetical protein|nr:MAG: hypothetical protein EOO77_01760 [Oxalobacteraceae bacterium]